jgi:hypothetical protein
MYNIKYLKYKITKRAVFFRHINNPSHVLWIPMYDTPTSLTLKLKEYVNILNFLSGKETKDSQFVIPSNAFQRMVSYSDFKPLNAKAYFALQNFLYQQLETLEL